MFFTSLFFLLSFLIPAENSLSAGSSLVTERSELHSAATVLPRKSDKRKPFRIRLTRPFPRTFENWDGHFSAQRFTSSKDKKHLEDIQKNLQKVFDIFPQNFTSQLKELRVLNQTHASRGLANKNTLILNTGTIDSNDELISVVVHELGHITDLGILTGKTGGASEFLDRKNVIFNSDPSVEFYRLSWIDSETKKSGIRRADFVSGYAAENPFEDFAESFLFYRLHGEKFRFLTQDSEVLQAKYNFLKNNIFDGEEFQTDKKSPEFAITASLIWDATLLEISDF